jgi:major vault protein
VEVMTKDYCPLSIEVSYRVNFTGNPSRWFDVENYVKFLTDHMRSVIRNAVQKMSVMEFFPNAISLLRDIVLGAVNDKKRRVGRLFEENGMHIYDLEVFEVTLEDDELETLIFQAQHANVKQKLALEQKHRELNFVRESEHTDQEIARAKAETQRQKLELHIEEVRKQLELNLERIGSEAQARLRSLEGQLAEQDNMELIQQSELTRDRARQELQIQFREQELTQHIREIQAEVEAVARKAEAISPDLVAALQAFSDRALAEKMAQTMAPLAILGGDSIAEVFARLLQNTPLEGALSALHKKQDEE